MRRLVVIVVLISGLASAGSLAAATGDGTLVVKNGVAPQATPVVQLTVTGSVIGKVDHGRVIIDAAIGSPAPQVTDAAWGPRTSTKIDTAQVWGGTDTFTFRAVGGKYTILVYGSGVNLVVVGKGTVRLAGQPDTPKGDGKYSLNGDDFLSLPGVQTDKLAVGSG